MTTNGEVDRGGYVQPGGRSLLVGQIEAAIRGLATTNGVVVVVAIGLDRVSQINDTWGYQTGDALLLEVDRRLASGFPSDRSGRVGSDHFVAVCVISEGDDVEAEIAQRAISAVAGEYTIGERAVYVTASVGVAGCGDVDGDPAALLSAAEGARVTARRSGGRRWERANQTMRVRVREQVRTEQALHSAIDNGEMSVRYQPVIEIASGQMVGVEALSRWISAQFGNVAPTDFIARAEDTGLIVPLGHWLLKEVRNTWRDLSFIGDSGEQLSIAVNVSGVQLRLDPDEIIRDISETAQVLQGQLSIEITESVLLEGSESVQEMLAQLKSAGVKVVIDDFGTGYSSLSQLRRLPVDAVKIDRVFVGRVHESARDRAIVDAMIQLAHALGILAIAEGVETPEQLDSLAEMSCDQAQGFLFSAAMPFDQLGAFASR